ncbi:DNA repair exonuclease [Sporosarcina pasteurii]|uniref:Exonuclease SbcCD, D subunit n=1 Tax=Sporosarcina pasteurii TaxID=1474 RepID=A0A380CA01_SPOPA|nr:DNA repair exonuclease [Sporosarcina pasteurii]MDS9472667.1 DNA repair exonuclease [Sporosarcina pasteurii]QBQ04327.1 DNA repair exonuclease [Sporosarcina pasteurii]SUJ15941.1 exonuclease SbcCD, D subunit [Sporosarcina pasteurii]
MSKLRFLHTADLHLDTPFKGMTGLPIERFDQLRNSTFEAFSDLIEYAIKTKPDFVLIVGDIYDGEDRSLRAQLKFQEGMKKLDEADIPVFISYGNHDHLKGNWTRFDLPGNVHVFDEKVGARTLNIRGETVNVYGFSYGERHIREAMVEQYPVAPSEGIHIGLLHGSLVGDESHAVYAPFTKEALLSKRYDYWALGHIHKRQQLHQEPPIVYPGNLQGRHRNERGMKGFYEVALSKGDAQLEFVPASTIVFEQISISCAGIKHAGQWFEVCTTELDAFQAKQGASILELQMIDIDEDAAELFNQSTEEEWLMTLREFLQEREPFVWISRISYERTFINHDVTEALINPIISTMESWTSEQWQDVLQDVYQHARSLKYLERLTEDDFNDIRTEAEKRLIAELSERK